MDEGPSIFESEEPFKIRTQNAVFMNSDALFIEYSDIIRSIDFVALLIINRMKEKFTHILDLSQIDGLTYTSLWEWYITRKTKNMLYDLLKEELKNTITFSDLDTFLNDIVSLLTEEAELVPELKFAETIRTISRESEGIVKKIFVWHPYNNEVVRKDIETLFGERVKFIYGPLDEVVKDIPKNSTFVFSDISNIFLLDEIDRLDLTSIIIPAGLKYNETEDGKLKVDVNLYEKKRIFKLSFFDNF